jgi:periplasmic protein CpxP/Spy
MKETFARNKILSLLLLFLLLTNIGMLVFFVYTKPASPQRHPDKDKGGEMLQMLEKQVGFTPDQLAQYKSLKNQHWDSIRPYFGEVRVAKDNFFKLINNAAVPDSVINAAADTIAAKQKKIDLRTFRYFQRLRSICTPQQQPAFDSVVSQVLKKMNTPWRNKNQPPKDSVKQ